MDVYYQSVGRGGVLLLNSTPNTRGLIPEGDLRLYEAFGREIARRFRQPVAEKKDQRAGELVLELRHPAPINHVVIMEDYRQGESIREYVVEGLREGQWHELSRGTAVGRQKIDRFAAVQVSRLRLRITPSVGQPLIRRFATFQVEGIGNAPELNRSKD